MVTFKAFVRKEGRITIPKDVRDAHRIRPGDIVRVIDIVKIEENKEAPP